MKDIKKIAHDGLSQFTKILTQRNELDKKLDQFGIEIFKIPLVTKATVKTSWLTKPEVDIMSLSIVYKGYIYTPLDSKEERTSICPVMILNLSDGGSISLKILDSEKGHYDGGKLNLTSAPFSFVNDRWKMEMTCEENTGRRISNILRKINNVFKEKTLSPTP